MKFTLQCFFLSGLLYSFFGCATAPPQRQDLRFQTDTDHQPIPIPKKTDRSEDWDRVYNELFRFIYNAGDIPHLLNSSAKSVGLKEPDEASNINSWDEVPDSSWFTNRLSKSNWTPEQAAQGPRTITGPDITQPWTVIKGKEDGQTPGFTILDAQRNMYFIKFDPPGFHQMASGAETVSSLVLHTLGYNVPSYFPVTVSPEIFRLGENAKTNGKYGQDRPMTEKDLKRILALAPSAEDGTVRVSASLALQGKPIGHFSFEGVRKNDPNDRIKHENRRELRALYIFSALINNNDIRMQNTLDMYVGKEDSGHIKHHLLDFGSTLGSAGYRPKNLKDGYEFFFDYPSIGQNFLTLGVNDPYWLDSRRSVYNSIGLFEARLFDPSKWRPAYPSAAFYNITPRDAFWAAKILIKLSDKHIQHIVREGKYTDPRAEEYLTAVLSLRRNKICDFWFRKMTPIDDFHIESKSRSVHVSFTDLADQVKLYPGVDHQYQIKSISDDTVNVLNHSSSYGRVSFQIPLKAIEKPIHSIRVNIEVTSRNLETQKTVLLGNGVNLNIRCINDQTECFISSIERRNP